MQCVFVDSSAWIALLNERDSLHGPATVVARMLKTRMTSLVTTEFVLVEVADSLASPALRGQVVNFVDGLRRESGVASSVIRIVPADSQLLAAGWDLFIRRPDKEWGLTDCISFAVMAREGITHAFASDHHFEQAGFVRLLSPK